MLQCDTIAKRRKVVNHIKILHPADTIKEITGAARGRENRSKVTKANRRRPRGCTGGISRLSLAVLSDPDFFPSSCPLQSRTRHVHAKTYAGDPPRRERLRAHSAGSTGHRVKYDCAPANVRRNGKNGNVESRNIRGLRAVRSNEEPGKRDALSLGTRTHFPLPALSNPDCHGWLARLLFTSDDE